MNTKNLIPWVLFFLIVFYGQFRNYRYIEQHKQWINDVTDYLVAVSCADQERECEIWHSFFDCNASLNVPDNFIPYMAKLNCGIEVPILEKEKHDSKINSLTSSGR